MKANEAPEKLYFGEHDKSVLDIFSTKESDDEVEYTRIDVFIEKACYFLKDHLAGYDICEDDIERSVESFKLAMKLWHSTLTNPL